MAILFAEPAPADSYATQVSEEDHPTTNTEPLRTKGRVKWFDSHRGFGFIVPDEGGADVFVHITAVEQADLRGLDEGQKVSYEIQVDEKRGKSSATNIKAA